MYTVHVGGITILRVGGGTPAAPQSISLPPTVTPHSPTTSLPITVTPDAPTTSLPVTVTPHPPATSIHSTVTLPCVPTSPTSSITRPFSLSPTLPPLPPPVRLPTHPYTSKTSQRL